MCCIRSDLKSFGTFSKASRSTIEKLAPKHRTPVALWRELGVLGIRKRYRSNRTGKQKKPSWYALPGETTGIPNVDVSCPNSLEFLPNIIYSMFVLLLLNWMSSKLLSMSIKLISFRLLKHGWIRQHPTQLFSLRISPALDVTGQPTQVGCASMSIYPFIVAACMIMSSLALSQCGWGWGLVGSLVWHQLFSWLLFTILPVAERTTTDFCCNICSLISILSFANTQRV